MRFKKEGRKMKKLINLAIIVILSLVLFKLGFAETPQIHYSSDDTKFNIPFGKTYNYANILVRRVVDGDTLILESGERVRLIGIDTPEIHDSSKLHKDSKRTGQDLKTIKAMGERSYQFTKNLAEGKYVSLEFDVDRFDRYDRLLAYVYLKDGTFINAKIVEEGYASLLTIPPNVKYADKFQQLYQQARENKRGLWGD